MTISKGRLRLKTSDAARWAADGHADFANELLQTSAFSLAVLDRIVTGLPGLPDLATSVRDEDQASNWFMRALSARIRAELRAEQDPDSRDESTLLDRIQQEQMCLLDAMHELASKHIREAESLRRYALTRKSKGPKPKSKTSNALNQESLLRPSQRKRAKAGRPASVDITNADLLHEVDTRKVGGAPSTRAAINELLLHRRGQSAEPALTGWRKAGQHVLDRLLLEKRYSALKMANRKLPREGGN